MRAGITSWLKNLKTRPPAALAGSAETYAPDTPFFAIGDVHGCAVQLEKLLAELDGIASGEENLVFLGDYIDRGPQTREVLTRLYDLNRRMPGRTTCLMGNHERMMLDFIDDPAGDGLHWLQNGGFETLKSFGVLTVQHRLDSSTCIGLANRLEAALPRGMQEWLRALPLQWSSGNMHCVHAAMSPRRAPHVQRAQTLLWGHPNFLNTAREDSSVVVHGHTIVKQAGLSASRISLDTGAYRTGRLSAARISTGACQFIEVQ
ncbi:serine/threonine protein phosphatase (plasmid) [Sulfitobacter sp. W027]|uniref:metallophosphoesterase family protein n=1 Tax=Sulfitobacter sp. W027 TaxID=2867025 RepID=UPI0021A5CF4C|nr:metallophosphoesterase family protein [Sulfitobacter sp. W027]UWR35715.1 serine/threonine protein phosphatase [Sulfitobacter sp. W027]